MAESTLTVAELKSRAEDFLDLDDGSSDLENKTVVIALNDFMAIYAPEARKHYKELNRESGTFTPNTPGVNQLTLSAISATLLGTKEGFVVRQTDKYGTRLFEVRKGGKKPGYFVEGGVLELYGFGDTQIGYDLYIEYCEKHTRYDFTVPDNYFDTTAPTTIPVEQGLEEAMEYFVASRYLIKDQGDPNLARNYRNEGIRLLRDFFTRDKTIVSIT